jgi:hypothetical protein
MHVLRICLMALGILALAGDAAAQVRASELATVQQTIDGTKLTIEYSRPAVRGRVVFPGLVHWGEKWTPGANWATTLEVDRDVRLAGQNIPAGKYSLWLIPREKEDWSLIVHRKARAYHTQRPDSANELARIAVKPQTGAHRERLTFDFPVITGEGGILQFHWGATIIDIPVRVLPSKPLALDSTTVRQVVGAYEFAWRGRQVRMDVMHENGKLRARMNPMVLPFDSVFDLLPLSKQRFGPFFYRAGKPFDLEDFVVFFDYTDTANATAVEWRGLADVRITRGNRTQ